MALRNKYVLIDSQTVSTIQIAQAPICLYGIFTSSVGTSGTMIVYDAIDATSTTNCIIDTFTLATGATYLGSIECSTGCYVETNGSPIVTVLTLSAD
jgi:hypothetical protein